MDCQRSEYFVSLAPRLPSMHPLSSEMYHLAKPLDCSQNVCNEYLGAVHHQQQGLKCCEACGIQA